MWQSVVMILVAIGVAIYEISRLRKKKYTKEIWVFSILLILATALSIMKYTYFQIN